MGYPSQRYLDSMANLYHSNNFNDDVVRERDVVLRSNYQRYIKRLEALSRAKFQEFWQAVQQEICQMRETSERMQMGSHWNYKDNDAKDDHAIRVKSVQFSYVDRFFDNDLIHIQPIRNVVTQIISYA